MKKIFFLAAIGMLALGGRAAAQEFAIKTNALGWAVTSINAAFEAGINKRTTIEIGGYYNPWTFKNNRKLKHWLVQPEFRLWNCERFNRGFWGVHVLAGQFNVGGMKLPLGLYPNVKNYRYQGWAYGAGVSYGYSWYLTPRLNLEATAGAGFVHTTYSRYECAKCGAKLGKGTKNYFGPTKLAVSLVYLF